MVTADTHGLLKTLDAALQTRAEILEAYRAIVRRHLLALDAAVLRLRRHAGRPVAALVADADSVWAIERGLQLCAQNALDIATHVTASAGHDVPDYASAIDRLSELGVLPDAFARRFRGVAGFRKRAAQKQRSRRDRS